MNYSVIGYDGTDDQALERRAAVRDQHLEMANKLKAEGKVLYAVAMLNDSQDMIGSVYIVNFETREELDKWLEVEPYVVGKVWEKIDIKVCKVAPAFLK